MIDYPNELNIIFDKLEKNEIKPIIVGGFNRDFLLGINSKDIDIELYGISSLDLLEDILSEFGSINSVGKSFGVCKLSYAKLDIDFSLPRVDNKVSKGHSGFQVLTNKNLDFTTAASRRDFTINAIGYDVKSKTILDPFDGIKDIKNKLLRAVNLDKFDEDPLRVMRAIQFFSRFNFTLDTQLFNKCQDMVNAKVLEELPHERVFEELKKLLLKSPSPSIGFKLLKQLNLFSFFKEFKTINNTQYTHVITALDKYTGFNNTNMLTNITTQLSILSLYFDRKNTLEFLNRLTKQKDIIKDIMILKEFSTLDLKSIQSDYDIFLLATKTNIEKLFLFLKAIHIHDAHEIIEKIKSRSKELDVFNKKLTALVEGKDLILLDLKPSPLFSKILNKVYLKQIKGEFTTKEDALEWISKQNYNSSSLL